MNNEPNRPWWKPFVWPASFLTIGLVFGYAVGREHGFHSGRQDSAYDFVNAPIDALRSNPGESTGKADLRRKNAATFLKSNIKQHVSPENREAAREFYAPLIDRLEY